MIALNFVSSLWNRFWTQKPQDVPVLEEEPDSPLIERSVEDLTEQVSPKRPAPLFIPPSKEPDIVIPKEFPAAHSPRKIDSPTPPLAAAESPRKIDSPTPPPVASTRPILRVKRSPQASPQKLQTPDARQIQEQTFSELREIFGAELVDRNVTPGKIYTPRELKELFVRLRQESPQGQQTRFFAALQKEFGDEVRFYRPQRDVLLSQAQRTAIASKLRFVDALKKLYDPRAVEAILPRFRAKEISDMGLMAQFVNRIGVMYGGKLVEVGPVRDIFKDPLHPYTQLLIGSLPTLESKAIFKGNPGLTPSLLSPPPGCMCAVTYPGSTRTGSPPARRTPRTTAR